MAEEGEGVDLEVEPKKSVLDGVNKTIAALREKVNKNAVVAAALNATFWGLGYVYNGKRRILGFMLMATELTALFWMYSNPSFIMLSALTQPPVAVSIVLFLFALAYDAYMDAVEGTKEVYSEE
jgi:hypothetical protein